MKPKPGHIIDDQGIERRVIGTLPITADGCVVGDVPDDGATVYYAEADGTVSTFFMTLCYRSPKDNGEDQWFVVENDELDGSGNWFATQKAARDKARTRKPVSA